MLHGESGPDGRAKMKSKMFTVALVSNQVQCNFIAWSRPVSNHETLEAAKEAANKEWERLDAEVNERPDIGQGAVMSESVIIHDGEETY